MVRRLPTTTLSPRPATETRALQIIHECLLLSKRKSKSNRSKVRCTHDKITWVPEAFVALSSFLYYSLLMSLQEVLDTLPAVCWEKINLDTDQSTSLLSVIQRRFEIGFFTFVEKLPRFFVVHLSLTYWLW